MRGFNRRERVDINPIQVSRVNQYYDCNGLVGWAVDVLCRGSLVTGVWSPEFEAAYKIGPRRTVVKKHQYSAVDDTTCVKILFKQKFARIGYHRAIRFKKQMTERIEKEKNG